MVQQWVVSVVQQWEWLTLYVGATIGSIVPGVGTVIVGAVDAIAGGICGATGGNLIGFGIDKFINRIRYR